MTKVPKTIPIADLRRGLSAILKSVRDLKEPVFITRRGRAVAVILSVEEYERSESERQILMLLANGEKAIATGRGHTLKAVLSESDAILQG